MTPTTLAEALDELAVYDSGDIAARLLALDPAERSALAAELLDVETLAACLNDAQMLPSEIRLGRDLTVIAARILAALRGTP